MIWLITLLALFLRFINLNQSLWLDEAIEILNASSHNIKYLYNNYSLGDFHPPIYHLLLRLWFYLSPPSELFSRLPSLIFGAGTVYLIYLIGKKLYDEKTGLIAALLLATAPLHIYYSQEARMYALAAFLASLSVYFFISLIEKDKFYLWVGFIASTVFMLYSDYLPYLLLPCYMVSLLFLRKKIHKHTLLSFIPAFFLILILLLPWLLIFPKQLHVGFSAAAASPTWAQVVGAPTFKNLILTFVKFTIGRISSDNNVRYILLFTPAALFASLLFLLSLFRMSTKRVFLYLWFFIPVTVAFIISFFIPIFAYFRFIFALPAFYLIWASAINTVNWALPTRILLVFALLINLISTSIYYLNPKFQRENWRGAAAYVLSNSSPNSIVLFESGFSMPPFDYYNHSQVKSFGALNGFSADSNAVDLNIKQLTKDSDKVFLFQYLSGITDPEGKLFQGLTRNNYKNTATQNFEGVGFVYEFSR